MSNKVVQSDNAVIDYTTIQSLIDAVNGMQTDIDAIKINRQATAPTTGNTGSVVKGTQVIDAGTQGFTSQGPVTITFNKKFSYRPTITFTVSGAGDTYAYILNGNSWSGNSSVKVNIHGNPKSGSVHWVAVGIE